MGMPIHTTNISTASNNHSHHAGRLNSIKLIEAQKAAGIKRPSTAKIQRDRLKRINEQPSPSKLQNTKLPKITKPLKATVCLKCHKGHAKKMA